MDLYDDLTEKYNAAFLSILICSTYVHCIRKDAQSQYSKQTVLSLYRLQHFFPVLFLKHLSEGADGR